MKESPCCARHTGAVVRAKAEVSRLANKAASQSARNHSIDGLKRQIARAKDEVLEAERAREDHIAEHAEVA